MKYLLSRAFVICYEGDDTVQSGTGDDTVSAGNNDQEKDKDLNLDELPVSVRGKTTFTQKDLNYILTETRLKNKTKVEKTIKDLETLQKSKALTERDRESLKARVEELQSSLLTKEQLAAKERERLETNHKQTVQSLTAERDIWQNRYVSSQINQAITSEGSKAEAFDVDDLIARLGPNTRLEEDKDEEGKSLGSFSPKVKFNDTDGEGKPIQLELTVEQAVKRMKETPKFAHLFKSTATGGAGASNGAGKSGKFDVTKATPAQYREMRKKEGLTRKIGQY